MKRTRFHGQTKFNHDHKARIGVLLVNLGTPDAPTTAALRRYLGEFLSDRRVVEIPAAIWKVILHGAVLRLRPKKSAEAYARVWDEKKGSPLMSHTAELSQAIEQQLKTALGEQSDRIIIDFAMRYGNPSVQEQLLALEQQGVDRLLVMPLYPQYCGATSGSSADAIFNTLRNWRWVPELRIAGPYFDNSAYIQAIANSIRQSWDTSSHQENEAANNKLIMSFHGMPKATLDAGDPYYCHCHKTARLLAAELQLTDEQWEMVFQSRFGAAKWLQPYAAERFESLPSEGVKHITLVCPGFAVDCLETIDEIANEGRESFLEAGGETFTYVPALNASVVHAKLLASRIRTQTADWRASVNDNDLLADKTDGGKPRKVMAIEAGAKQ